MVNSDKSIFLSYGGPDKPFVRKLAADLRRLGVAVWFDDWEIRVGDSISGAINAAISNSAYFGAVISGDSVNRPWVQKELQVGMHFQVEGRLKILPILLTSSPDIPPFVKELRYADFSGPYRLGLRDLVLSIDPAKAYGIAILEADISIDEKIGWFLDEFSFDYLRTNSSLPPRKYFITRQAREKLFNRISVEVRKEYEHLSVTEEYSRKAANGHKAAVAYVRDLLDRQTIDPFHSAYWLSSHHQVTANFKRSFLAGDWGFESYLLDFAKKEFASLFTRPAYRLVNEGHKLSLLDKIIFNFERFCLFKSGEYLSKSGAPPSHRATKFESHPGGPPGTGESVPPPRSGRRRAVLDQKKPSRR